MDNTVNFTIIRGVAGSGKSTESKNYSGVCFEADMYFTDPTNGSYNWNPNDIGKAHKWCQSMVEKQLQLGNDVIVANTTLSMKELKPYLDMVERCIHTNILVTIVEMRNWYGSIHSVPAAVIERMKKTMISNEEIKSKIGNFVNFKYVTIN